MGVVVLWYHVPGIVSRGVIMEVYDRGSSPSSRHSWWRMSLRTHIAPFWCAGLVTSREHVGVVVMC